MYLRVRNNKLFFSKAMVAIQYGLSGRSVPYHVEMDVAAVHGLAPILHRALVVKIAHNWDLIYRRRLAMLKSVQVKIIRVTILTC